MEQDRFSRAFSFILYNGTELFQVQIKRRDTGVVAYRISRRGATGNTLEASEEADKATMTHKVLDFGYAVRCASLDGKTKGLYKPGQRSVRQVRQNKA